MDADRLKKIPVFADVDPDATSIIAKLASEVSVPAGKELVRQGDYSYDLLAIEEGTAEVTRGGWHVADLGPGYVLGERDRPVQDVLAVAAVRGLQPRLGRVRPVERLPRRRAVLDRRGQGVPTGRPGT